jgi:hypothetical protein
MPQFLVVLLLCIGLWSDADAQTQSSVAVTSETEGTQLVGGYRNGASVFVETGGTSVWIGRFPNNTDCTSAQTDTIGKTMMIPADAGWAFYRTEENFNGVICGVLDAAGSATVRVEIW